MMTIGELDEIAQILFRDNDYRHFSKKIRNDFFANKIDDTKSDLLSFYIDNTHDNVGFCIVGDYSVKMKMWEKIFIEEEWVDKDFKISPNSIELMYLYIMPEYREQRKASALFEKVMSYAIRMGKDEIYAYVSAPDTYALDFYKKRGAETICSFSDEEFGNFTAFLRWNLK